MIVPSTELSAIIRRWGKAISERDTETLRNLLSTTEYLSYIGSAEGELWTGQVLRDGIGEHFREVPEFEEGEGNFQAFEMGDVGWAYNLLPLKFKGSNHFVMHRITFVLTLEAGAWKIAHIHMSNPVSNIDKMGVENLALDALVAAAQDDFVSVGSAGMASVMFTDVVDSTLLAETLGDRMWSARIDDHLRQVTDLVTAQGGTLVKSLGDGTMSTFSSAQGALKAP